MPKPLCIDLFCGLGGWAEGFLSEGYDVIGFDIIKRPYPGQLVLQDCLTLSGRQFRGAAVIVASPPCQDFSRWDQHTPNVIARRRDPDKSLWRACERIAHEADVPLVLENVRGAQKFMGSAKAHYGSRYLWGAVPTLIPYQPRDERTKTSMSSAWKDERAKIPFPLAQHIARVFKPVPADAKPL